LPGTHRLDKIPVRDENLKVMHWKSIALPCLLLLAFPALGAATQVPFETDIPVEFTFAEEFHEKVNGDCDILVKSQSSPPVMLINFSVSMTGVDPNGLAPSTPFDFSFGYLNISGLLSEDASYAPGRKMAKIRVETDWGEPAPGGDDFGDSGYIEMDWRNGRTLDVTIRLTNLTEDYFLASDFTDSVYAGADETNPDPIDIEPGTSVCEFVFGERVLTRQIYFEGTADATYNSTCDESLDQISITGRISTPSVFIDSPAEGAEELVPFPTISGTSTNIDVAEITEITVEGEDGQQEFAVLTGPFPIVPPPASGPTDQWIWTTDLIKLRPGKNTITVVATDEDGIDSLAAERIIYYPLKSTVTVSRVGEGTLSGGYPGTKSVTTSSILKLDAKPVPGWVFAGWTGSETSSAPRLNFEVVPNSNLTATFVEGPYLEMIGTYAGGGALPDANPGTATGVKLVVSVLGNVTGQLFIDGQRFAVRGQFDETGHFTQSIVRSGLPPATLTLTADLLNFQDVIAVEVTSDGNSATFDAGQLGSQNLATLSGRYTVALLQNTTPPFDGPTYPAGNGYAVLTVKSNGNATLVGKLSDGTRFSAAGPVSSDDTLFLYTMPHRNSGWFSGQITFQDLPDSDADGLFSWSRPEGMRFGKSYTAGFATPVPVIAARYTPPPPNTRVFPNDSPTGTVIAGDSSGDLFSQPVTISTANAVLATPPNPDHLSLRITARTGLFTGSFTNATGRIVRFNGAILQKPDSGFGFFLDGQQSGYLDFTSP
jgi:hypothetical protein